MLDNEEIEKFLSDEGPLPKHEYNPNDYYGVEESKRNGLDVGKFGLNSSDDDYYGK